MAEVQQPSRISLGALAALTLIEPICCQEPTGTVFGIGIGTFIIILSIVFSMVWCLACRSSSNPEVYSIIGICIPAVLILVFIFMPKQVDRPTTTEISDSNLIPHILFLVVAILGFLLAMAFLVVNFVFTFKKAKNITRATFISRNSDQNEKLITNQSGFHGKSFNKNEEDNVGESNLGNSKSNITENLK